MILQKIVELMNNCNDHWIHVTQKLNLKLKKYTMPKAIASKMTENPCHQWGLGKNKMSSDAKAFIQKFFDDGLKKRPAVASEVEILMQEVNNEEGLPRFDRNSYLDEDQIKVGVSEICLII